MTGFEFRLLENADTGLEERKESLQGGMIMDLGPHVLALVIPFGDPVTVQHRTVRAGIYGKSDVILTVGSEMFYSGRESFAEIAFSFTPIFDNQVNACRPYWKMCRRAA